MQYSKKAYSRWQWHANAYEMTEEANSGVGNGKKETCMSGYLFDKSEYNLLKVTLLYYFELDYSLNNDI